MKPGFFVLILLLLYGWLAGAWVSAQAIKGSYWEIRQGDSLLGRSKSLQAVVLDTLCLDSKAQPNRIPVNSITELRRIRNGSIGRGMIIGAGSGFLLGAILGAAGNSEEGFMSTGEYVITGAVLLAVPGFLIGTAIGALNSKDKIHDLSAMALPEKSQWIGRHCTELEKLNQISLE